MSINQQQWTGTSVISNEQVSNAVEINERPINDDQLDTLRHMLGINDPSLSIPAPYRNYAAVIPGDSHFQELAKAGLVERYREAGNGTEYDWYRCTEAGKRAAVRSFRSIQYPKARRRYIAWLRIRDVFPGLTFREFLIGDDFAEVRENA